MPLKEVHRSGGYNWDKAKKQEYANDLKNPETLIAVDKSANRSKSNKDQANGFLKIRNIFVIISKVGLKLRKNGV